MHVLISAIVALVLCLQVPAKGKLVEDLELRGYRQVQKEEILKLIKTRPGNAYDDRIANADLARLIGTGWFDSEKSLVQTEKGPRGGILVRFLLTEKANLKPGR